MYGDTPYQSARRAWSHVEDLLRSLRNYVENPTAPEDQAHARPERLAEIDRVLERLREADALWSDGSGRDAPPPEFLDLLKEAESLATQIKSLTFVEKVDNPELDLNEIRRLIRDAEPHNPGHGDEETYF